MECRVTCSTLEDWGHGGSYREGTADGVCTTGRIKARIPGRQGRKMEALLGLDGKARGRVFSHRVGDLCVFKRCHAVMCHALTFFAPLCARVHTIPSPLLQGGSAAPAAPSLGGVTSPRSLERAGSLVPQMLRGSVEWLMQSGPGQRLAAEGASLRPFASGGMLLQLGSFQRNLLDFTRVMAKVWTCFGTCGRAL